MPTVPTMNPTASPIPVDVSCGEQREGPSDGEWEYYLDIDNDSIVTFDTCSSYLNLFSMWIYTGDDNISSTLYADCIECGSICLEESQFRVAMDADTYFMVIDGAHRFEVICEPEKHPTSEPTQQSTPDVSSVSPSTVPTTALSHPTIVSDPTEQENVVNVTVRDVSSPTPYLSDPFGRFKASNIMDPTTDVRMKPIRHRQLLTASSTNGNYYVVNTTMSWSEGNTYCQTQYGTSLGTIRSDEDAQTLLDLFESNGDYWIGLYDYSGDNTGWEWASGYPWFVTLHFCATSYL